MTTTHSSTQCTNPELIAELTRLARNEREATVALIALLAEFDRRKLYLAEGCSSLFTYCTQALHLSEHAAYGRIEAARAAQEFPLILNLLVEGAVNLTTIALLRPHLTTENHASLLGRARGKRKREIEELVVQLRPQPAVPSAIRKLPEPRVPSAPPLNVRQGAIDVPEIDPAPMRPEVKPLAPERYKVQFTVDKDTYDKLRRAQDLLRHSVPNGDLAAIFSRALNLLLGELERKKMAATDRPRTPSEATPGSRHVPAAVRRTVWARDGGRCAFEGTHGRCGETGFLEYHHVVPFADGGETTAANIQLRCRSHNAYEAEQYFGPRQPPLVREAREVYGEESPARSGPSRAPPAPL